jgi:hypothetical protein
LQDPRGIEDVVGQVLDEHQKQADDLLLLGEGTSNSTMINNGLYLVETIQTTLSKAQSKSRKAPTPITCRTCTLKLLQRNCLRCSVSGRKVVIFYGSTMLAKVSGIYLNSSQPFKKVLADALGPNYSIVELPSAVTPSGANGFIIANYDQSNCTTLRCQN